ncbi:MAG TPA: hypothetical protein DHV62_09955, partial [Elusimicrobia bacterium]|nr:hypothetical protein [Elusimicrobiota bacterium]
IKNLIKILLNLIESQSQIIESQKKDIQSLKDEINRLKGEKGKPKISPNVPEKEEDTQNLGITEKKKWTKSAKKPRIKIDRTEYISVDKNLLPPDAEHKGYRTIIIQNIKFATDNVEYKLEYYYSPSENKT